MSDLRNEEKKAKWILASLLQMPSLSKRLVFQVSWICDEDLFVRFKENGETGVPIACLKTT